MSLIAELTRRNVVRVAVFYLVAAWLVMQVADVTISLLELPSGTGRVIFIVLALGFPVALAISWKYEFTPSGLKPEEDIDRSAAPAPVSGKRLTALTGLLLALSLLTVALNQWIGSRIGQRAPDSAPPSSAEAAAATSSVPEFSVAVLPFLDRSERGDQAYLADGVAEDVAVLLAQIPGMHVIARTSSFSYRDRSADAASIARELNVAYVLEGSVRRGTDKLRVTAQLVQAGTGYPLWSGHFDRPLGDLYSIQAEVAKAVVWSLKQAMFEAPPTVRIDPEAYRLTLEARYLVREQAYDDAALEAAEVMLRQALDLEPGYADALIELGRIAGARGRRNGAKESLAAERDYYQQALQMDPDSANAMVGLAWSDLMAMDFASAGDLTSKILAADPQNLGGLVNASVLLKYLGRLEAAAEVEQYLVSRDPLSATRHANLGLTLLSLGRLEAAEAAFRKVLDLHPGDVQTHYWVGLALLLRSQPEAALAEFERADPRRGLAGRVLALHDLGQIAESDAAMKELAALVASDEPSLVAFAHAYRNEVDAAFEWFDREFALSGKGPWFNEWKWDPLLANLRSDPRWPQMFARAGLADEQLMAIKFDVALPDPGVKSPSLPGPAGGPVRAKSAPQRGESAPQ